MQDSKAEKGPNLIGFKNRIADVHNPALIKTGEFEVRVTTSGEVANLDNIGLKVEEAAGEHGFKKAAEPKRLVINESHGVETTSYEPKRKPQ